MDRRSALKALMGLPAVAGIAVARLQPHDVIVLECEDILSTSQIERLRAQLSEFWPGTKAIILSRGMKLKVVSADDIQGQGV